MIKAFALGVAIVVALSAVGAMHGATKSSATVTAKVMVEGLKEIHYPVAQAKRLTCRGLGAALNGRHASFRCVAAVKAHGQRRFYARAVAQGGWLCAGRTLSAARRSNAGSSRPAWRTIRVGRSWPWWDGSRLTRSTGTAQWVSAASAPGRR